MMSARSSRSGTPSWPPGRAVRRVAGRSRDRAQHLGDATERPAVADLGHNSSPAATPNHHHDAPGQPGRCKQRHACAISVPRLRRVPTGVQIEHEQARPPARPGGGHRVALSGWRSSVKQCSQQGCGGEGDRGEGELVAGQKHAGVFRRASKVLGRHLDPPQRGAAGSPTGRPSHPCSHRPPPGSWAVCGGVRSRSRRRPGQARPRTPTNRKVATPAITSIPASTAPRWSSLHPQEADRRRRRAAFLNQTSDAV